MAFVQHAQASAEHQPRSSDRADFKATQNPYGAVRLQPPNHLLRSNSARSQSSSSSINFESALAVPPSSHQVNGMSGHHYPSGSGSTHLPDDVLETLSAPQPVRLNSDEMLGSSGQGQLFRTDSTVSGTRRERRMSVNSRMGPSPPPPPGPPPSEPPPLPPPPSATAPMNRTSPIHSASSVALQGIATMRRVPSVQGGQGGARAMMDSNFTSGQEPILGPPVMSMGVRQPLMNGHGSAGGASGYEGLASSAEYPPMQRTLPRKSSMNALNAMSSGVQPYASGSRSADLVGNNGPQVAPLHRPRVSNANSLATNTSTSTARPPRIPSKQLLQLALDLAQKAVELDRGNDVEGALRMYREAVGQLRAVMERVGIEVGPVPVGLGLPDLTDKEKEEADHARRKRQANGSARPEDEGRTLRGIHDAYIARIGLLIVMQAAQRSPASSIHHVRNDSDAHSRGSHNPSSPAGSTSAIGHLMLSGPGGPAESIDRTPVQPIAAVYNNGKGKEVDRGISMELVNGVMNARPASDSGSIHAELDALYPPPISAPPQPRPRVTSLQQIDRDAINLQTPQLSGPDINIVSGTPTWTSAGVGNSPHRPAGQPIIHGRKSSIGYSEEVDRQATTHVQGIPSARSESSLGSARSGKRRSARESLMKTPSAGLHQELGEQSEGEDQEVLSQTPTGEATGDHLEPIPSPVSSGYDGNSRPRRDPFDAPLISPRTASLGSTTTTPAESPVKPVLISASTAAASSMQRRRNGGERQLSISSVIEEDETSYDVIRSPDGGVDTPATLSAKTPSEGSHALNLRSATFLGDWSKDISKIKNEASLPARLRTRSQPGKRPSISKTFDPSEPMPPLPGQTPLSPSGGSGKYTVALGSARGLSNTLSPGPSSGSTTLPIASPRRSPSLPSPLPEATPSNPLHRPFHLMRLISKSVQSPTGGFLSDRLHVPRAMWVQTTVKVPALETKVRVVDLLTVNMLNVARAGGDLLVDPEESQVGRGRSDASARNFVAALEEFEGLMDEIQKMLSKKLGLTGIKSKSGIGGLGSKFAKTLDKMTTGKNVESPTAYVESLSRLCHEAQAIDRHIYCLTSPARSGYDTLPRDIRQAIENRIRHVSEFFSQVLLAFVFQDIGLMLSKYLKHSTRWIEE